MSQPSRILRAPSVALIVPVVLIVLIVGAAACGRKGLDLLEGQTPGVSGGAGTTGQAGAPGSAGTIGAAGTTGAAGSTGRAGTTGSAGTTGVAGTTGAAGAGVPDPALPLASTPNKIRCGDVTCPVETDYCCANAQYMGDLSNARFNMCSATFCGFRRECDETADCLRNEVCCYSVFASPPAVLGSTCVPKGQCAYDGAWIGCSSQNDCRAAGADEGCVAQECRGATIQTCGQITRTVCKN